MSISPLHGFPLPDDNDPLDADGWSSLIDAVGIGVPFICSSQAEQNAYVAACTAAGLGPSSTNILRVCRTDLGNLTMINDGTGFVRESGGELSQTAFSNTGTVESAGTTATRGAINLDLPCAADVSFILDVTGEPTNSLPWAFYVWAEDNTGRELTPHRAYGNLPINPYTAFAIGTARMPAGSSQIRLRTLVNSLSQPIRFAAVGLSVHYA